MQLSLRLIAMEHGMFSQSIVRKIYLCMIVFKACAADRKK